MKRVQKNGAIPDAVRKFLLIDSYCCPAALLASAGSSFFADQVCSQAPASHEPDY